MHVHDGGVDAKCTFLSLTSIGYDYRRGFQSGQQSCCGLVLRSPKGMGFFCLALGCGNQHGV